MNTQQVIAAAMLLWVAGPAQAAEPLVEINTGHGPVVSSNPRDFATLASELTVFVADDAVHGSELWQTNGAQATLLADIMPGHLGSDPVYLVSGREGAYYRADDGTHGSELWVTNGTPAGTRRVADLAPGRDSSDPWHGAFFQESVYFTAATRETGREIWRVKDGVVSLVADINPGPDSSFPSQLTVIGEHLVFRACTPGKEACEPWRIDKENSVSMVADINPGPVDGIPTNFAPMPVNGLMVFQGETEASGSELWVSNPAGLPEETRLLAELAPGPASGCCGPMVVHQGWVYFSTRIDTALWRTDGRAVELLVDLPGPVEPVLSRNGLLYLTVAALDSGQELWISDGTAGGTQLLKDINPGPSGSFPRDIRAGDGAVLFLATSSTRGLWRTDGTPDGTFEITQLAGADPFPPGEFGSVREFVIFSGSDPMTGSELWRSDGSLVGTMPLQNIAADSDDAQVASIRRLKDRWIFTAFRPDEGVELWSTMGGDAHVLLADTLPGPAGGLGATQNRGLPMLQVGEFMFFFRNDDFFDELTLWRTDGTPGGTFRSVEFGPGDDDFDFGGSYQPRWAALDEQLFMIVEVDGQDALYRIDPETGGQEVLAAGLDVGGIHYGAGLVAVGSLLFFDSGRRIWRSDGTPAGTFSVSEFLDDGDGIAGVGNAAFISIDDNLWRSDGTESGTFALTAFDPGRGRPRFLTPHGDQLFFVANDDFGGHELWVSDGTAAGTERIKDIFPGADSSWPFALTSTPGGLYFAAHSPDAGTELWITDGTELGTRRVIDLATGPESSGLPRPEWLNQRPENVQERQTPGTPVLPAVEIVPIDQSQVIFSAWDAAGGTELWITDGSAAGTLPLTDIAAGPGNSNPAFLSLGGSELLFSADDGETGRELWKLDLNTVRSDDLFKDGFE